jgi:hypothetical protein
LGLFDRVFGASKPTKAATGAPPRTRKRKSAAEKIADRRVAFLGTLEQSNPRLYEKIMLGEIAKEFGLDDGDPPPPVDPFADLIQKVQTLRQLQELMPSESRSELGGVIRDLLEGLGGFLRSPAGAAIIAGAAGAAGGMPPRPPGPPPPGPPPPIAQLPPPEPILPPAPAPIPTPPQNAPQGPPEAPGDAPEIPLDRFLPLLDLAPPEAAERLWDLAVADEEKGDLSLWRYLELAIRDGADGVLGMLRVVRFVPAYRAAASRLLGNEPWVRALVDALRAIAAEEAASEPTAAGEGRAAQRPGDAL